MAGEDNTLTMVVLPGRCAGPSWGKGGLPLISQSPSRQLIMMGGPFPMPTAWTMSRIEAVIFIATVVLTASAGTWLAVG
jgi:hypothetical protein